VTRLRFVSAIGGSAFMEELLEVVADEVRALGVDVTASRGAFPQDDGDDVFVVVPHEYFVLTPPEELPGREVLDRTVAFCVEHPGNATFEVSARWAAQLGGAVDINRDGADELARRGVPVVRFRLGYSRRWDRWQGDLGRPRPCDVTYLGTTDDRRDFLLGNQARWLSEFRTALLIPPHEQMTRPRPDFLMGSEKHEHLASSKILLNLHRGASTSLEWVRVLEAMCNGCVVVSEQSTDFEPLVPGVHLAFAREQAVVPVAASLLRTPDRLRELQTEAYEFLKAELSMAGSSAQLVELAESLLGHGPSPVAVSAAPIASPEPMPVVPEPRVKPSGLPEPTPWITQVPPAVRAEIARTHARALRSCAVEIAERPLRGDAAVSIDAIVSRGRDDGGLARALRGLDGQEVATRVLVGTASVGGDGLGVAHARIRNALLAQVRAPHVLVIQPHQELFPGALQKLLDPLDRDPTVAATYGMMFDPTSGSLWNALPVEPERLARRAYLHAPVLVRSEVLDALDGFDEDPSLISYEDQDFWLRFVSAGFCAELVAEIVGIGPHTAANVFTPSTWMPEATAETLAGAAGRLGSGAG
jgi:hypothetical protein